MRKERFLYIATIIALILFLGFIGNSRANIGNVFSTKAQKVLEAMFDASGDISTITFANKETIKNSTDRRIMFGSDTTTTGIFGLILDAGSTGTVDIDVCIYFSDDGDETTNSLCWDDGIAKFSINGWLRLANGNLIFAGDDAGVYFGASDDAFILWETADANANALILYMPEGGATNVPVFVIGDVSINNVDLGFFNGVTNPSIAVISDDASDYVRLSVTDAGLIQLNSSVTSVSSSTTNSVTNKIVIEINGTSYYLLASTSGT